MQVFITQIGTDLFKCFFNCFITQFLTSTFLKNIVTKCGKQFCTWTSSNALVTENLKSFLKCLEERKFRFFRCTRIIWSRNITSKSFSNQNLVEKSMVLETLVHICQVFVMQLNDFPDKHLKRPVSISTTEWKYSKIKN